MFYEYKCTTCKKEFEKRLPVSECTAEQTCPECGSPAKRLYSKATIHWGESYPGEKLEKLNSETLKYER